MPPVLKPLSWPLNSLDAIEIGAWGAKAEGILGVAKQSLHIELPAHHILGTANAREAYQNVLAVLLDQSVGFLLSPAQRLMDVHADLTISGASIESVQDN